MSEASVAARKAMKDKARRMTGADNAEKVDASSWTPSEPENADKATGLRPISPRAYRRGGKVGMVASGEKTATRADRKPRKSGGSANDYINRDVKAANAEKGKPHIGGYKNGGRPGKMFGGQMVDPRALAEASVTDAGNRSGVGSARMSFQGSKGTPLPYKKGGEARKKRLAGGRSLGETVDTQNKTREMDDIERNNYRAQRSKGFAKGESQYHATNPPGRLFDEGTPDPWDEAEGKMRGGKAKHSDEAEDKALIKKMVKKADLKPAAKCGGGAMKNGGKALRARGGKAPEWEQRQILDRMNEKTDRERNAAATRKTFPNVSKMTSEGHPDWDAMGVKGTGQRARGGKASHGTDCDCKACRASGGKAGNYTGGTRPTGGRIAKASGGRTGKGKMNVNIVIAQPGQNQPAGQPPMQPPPRPAMPIPVLPPTMAPQMGGISAPPAAMPSPVGAAPPMSMPMPMPMPRQSGGRTYRSYKDMDAGSLGGMGRLEKSEIQAHKR